MDLKGKNVLVYGAGISGLGAVGLLLKIGACPILFDENKNQNPAGLTEKLPAGAQVPVVLGEIPQELLTGLSLAVLSPGVPLSLPTVERLKKAQIPIWGEIELAYENGAGDVLAITGTNGKTTTTSLLGEIMRHHSENIFVVGNIGTPYTGEALKMNASSVTVAEISSFQLETIDRFRPKVSAILNITPDHLNRHHTMEEYIRVKELITKNQTEDDTCVLNREDPVLREFGKKLVCRTVYFSSLHRLEKGLWMEKDDIVYGDGEHTEKVISTTELNILGRHNHENVMAAVGMALSYGVPMEEIRYVLRRFVAVEHRIEFVCEKKGVAYYNDSKGTNPDAAIKGIQAMNRPTILIGGGYDKGSEFDEWIQSFEGKVRYLVLLGQTREKIADTARKNGFHEIILVDSLEEAVQVCAEKADKGDAVLLSPACASWGMFPNYEVRGRRFKELVRGLEE